MAEPWYVKSYDEHYYETYRDEFTPEQTQAEVEGVVALLGLKPGARILDLCCGFGRHSIELARRGYRMTGLDLSPDLLRHAREAAVSAGVTVDWIEADMRAIPMPDEPYKAVINMFSSFGFFGDDAEEMKAADAVARVLAPDGAYLIDTVNREIILRRWASLRWREMADGTLFLDRLRFEIETGILHTQETLVRPSGERLMDEHHTRLWSYTEMVMLLRAAGFGDFRPYGDLQGGRYTWDSFRMTIAARKITD